MAESKPTQKLTKKLYTDITRLKLLDDDEAEVRFRLEKTPFTGEEEDITSKEQEEYTIIGKIFPKSSPFNERSYRVELKLIKTYPMDPPAVRFSTPIYHPHVEKDGIFCTKWFDKTFKWTANTSLVEVIKTVVQHIDHPDVDSSIRAEVGREYQENRAEFNRKAAECVQKHGLPRE